MSVNIITNREGGLDAQLHYFAHQTEKDFEMVIIDNLWSSRHNSIETLIRLLGLDVVYIRPRRHLDNVVCSTHAMARNEALTYADAKYILFFDDYQIPTDHLISEHLVYLHQNSAVAGQQTNLKKMDIFHPNLEDVKMRDPRNIDNQAREIHYAWFWTNNASVPLSTLLKMNGFDERFNGGTGGEDYGSIGLSLMKQNAHIIYNPNALCYHIYHNDVQCANKEYRRLPDNPKGILTYEYMNHVHNLAPFIENPYHNGDRNLMENEQFKCWHDKWGLKHYRCKYCGIEGICDSLEVHDLKMREDTFISPPELFDLMSARAIFDSERDHKYVK